MPDSVKRNCSICLLCVVILLIVILIPLSFEYLEYYEYGLDQRRTTGSVDTTKVYDSGRYFLGPDHGFIRYQADAHYVPLDQLEVFSAGSSNESIGLAFKVDVDFTFFLIEDEIGDLHKELASNYRNVIISRARDAIKNEAVFITFTEYFQARKLVETRFRQAVQARWNENPSLHCTLDQFHVGRIRIPDSVATKQLESRVQNERNDKEKFLQQAQIERELTAVAVNEINLDRDKILRTAQANASLIRSRAVSEAELITSRARVSGTRFLLNATQLLTQDHITAYTYIRTLRQRDELDIDVSYLPGESVLRTTQG